MDSLQFQKAEYADPRPVCAGCKNPIDGSYYTYGGRAICEGCSAHVRSAQSRPAPEVSLAKPLMYGAGAALGCSAGYALITAFSGLEIALVAILVGYLVGRAVRIGAGGAGGRPLQVIAVLLTYAAITLSNVLLILRHLSSATGSVVPLLPTIVGLSLVSPLMNLRDGIGGILGIVILGVGLMQAWRQTAARTTLPLLGPFDPEQGNTVV